MLHCGCEILKAVRIMLSASFVWLSHQSLFHFCIIHRIYERVSCYASDRLNGSFSFANPRKLCAPVQRSTYLQCSSHFHNGCRRDLTHVLWQRGLFTQRTQAQMKKDLDGRLSTQHGFANTHPRVKNHDWGIRRKNILKSVGA